MTKRNILVTGGGIGIGRAICLAFGSLGERVLVTDVLDKEGAETVASIREAGGDAEFFSLDVRDTGRANEVVAMIEEQWGALDVVVANAGIAHRIPLDALTDVLWDNTFEVDLKGMWRVVRPALHKMRAAGRGSVICLTSLMGTSFGWSEHVAYSSAKAGVLGFVRSMAAELGPSGIRVNAIAPGFVRTAQALSREHSLGPEGLEAAASSIPLRRVAEPEDIASIAVFLASNASSYVTGQAIVVDGGLSVVI